MIVQEHAPGQFRPWAGEPLTVLSSGQKISAPASVGEVWSDAELAEVGLYRAVPFSVPEGHDITGPATYARVGDQVIETIPTAPVAKSPEAVRVEGFAAQPDVVDLLNRLKTAPNSGAVDTWLANNMTTLPQARAVVGAMIKVLIVLLQKELR
jgi:hypothetical protein